MSSSNTSQTSSPDYYKYIMKRVVDVKVKGRGLVLTVETDQGVRKLFFSGKRGSGQSLSKLARMLGFRGIGTLLAYIKKNKGDFLALINNVLDMKPLYVSTLITDSSRDSEYVYAIGTEKFTEIPHRILFQAVLDHLRSRNVWIEKQYVVKHGRRTILRVILYKIGDEEYGLAVSNSNIGVKAIHVYPILISMPLRRAYVIKHVGRVEDIIDKTIKAVDEAVLFITENKDLISRKLKQKVARDEVLMLLRESLEKKVSRKLVNWLIYVLNKLFDEKQHDELEILELVKTLTRIADSRKLSETAREKIIKFTEKILRKYGVVTESLPESTTTSTITPLRV